MDVLEIAPGLWRWTGYHEEWRQEVGSVHCETEDGVVLIDPLVPPEDTERFWRALDRDVERLQAPGQPVRPAAELLRAHVRLGLLPPSPMGPS